MDDDDFNMASMASVIGQPLVVISMKIILICSYVYAALVKIEYSTVAKPGRACSPIVEICYIFHKNMSYIMHTLVRNVSNLLALLKENLDHAYDSHGKTNLFKTLSQANC